MNWSISESLAKRTGLTGTLTGSSPVVSISVSKSGRSITKSPRVGASRARPSSMVSTDEMARFCMVG